MSAQSQVASLLREQLAYIISGTFFVLIGLIAFSISALRRRGGVRILFFVGLWSAMYGVNEGLHSEAIMASLPGPLRTSADAVSVVLAYLMVIAGTLSFLDLSLKGLRRLLRWLLVADAVVAVAGIGWFFVFRQGEKFLLYNNLLAAFTLAILFAVVAVPALSRQFLVVSGHRVLTGGTVVFAAQALHSNLSRPFHFASPAIYSSVGFAVLLLSFGYTALKMIIGNERRLLSIQNELEIARQLQFSILPGNTPQLPKLRVAATYLPMAAVAGDFYEFVQVDQNRVGFLVADVSGHGVPAALIASMIKVAMNSVNDCATNPAEVLRRLGDILSRPACDNLISAAYLWIDTESWTARYSAAGHPPLLCWRSAEGALQRIESNGLLFGVTSGTEYPQREIPLATGDRFLLYTDGVTEPENASGESFGDRQLEQVVRDLRSRPGSELSARVLDEVRAWQSGSEMQQDDITLIVIDVM
jgi:phosphoserine phosphatase RsbU/P